MQQADSAEQCPRPPSPPADGIMALGEQALCKLYYRRAVLIGDTCIGNGRLALQVISRMHIRL